MAEKYMITTKGTAEDPRLQQLIALGENERQAVDIFVILYNAYLLTPRDPWKGAITNQSEQGHFATSYLCNIEDFETLQEYFKDVHDMSVYLTIF